MAMALYRALLLTMPASVHQWYTDLSDKSLAHAVKDYTVSHESSFLLQQELDMVQASHYHLLNACRRETPSRWTAC